jgi:uncharacterized protein (DUF1697 family)
MFRHILLLRGVNVSGANKVKMADLRAFLAELGFTDVQTYIQSGNAVFSSPKSTDEGRSLMSETFPSRFGFLPKMMLLTAQELAAAIAGNPYADREFDPAWLHAGFMADEPEAEAMARVADKSRTSEEYEIRGRVFYLFTPDGLGTSKFAEGLERTLKLAVTFRNWRTVLALGEMAGI